MKKFGVQAEIHVISAHRTPDEAHAFASQAEKNGVEVIICAAGKAAHLGGVIAAYTTLPVIGLPVKTDMMGGLTACSPSCRCLPAFPSPPSASTEVKTRACSPFRFWRSAIRNSEKNSNSSKNPCEKIHADDAALQEELKAL